MEREITHSCGHPQRHYVGGFYAGEREREAMRLSRRRCASCRGQAGRAAVTDAVANMTRYDQAPGGVALPPLAGSARQVAWAEDIRLHLLAALRRLDPGAADGVAAMKDARWWIERRGDDPGAVAAHVGPLR